MDILKINVKKAVCTFLCCAILIFGTGVMANASTITEKDGPLTGTYNSESGLATAKVQNTKSATRYCSVALRVYTTKKVNASTAAYREGAVAVGKKLTVTYYPVKKHVFANGVVYSGNVPSSGSKTTYTVDLN